VGRDCHTSAKISPRSFLPLLCEQSNGNFKLQQQRQIPSPEIFSSTKGGLIKSFNNIKTLPKTKVTVPRDFQSFVFLLKAFTLAIMLIFGDDSILAIKLHNFVARIDKKHSIIYKNQIATSNIFAIVGGIWPHWICPFSNTSVDRA
jgi:hypothetical protein